MANRGRVVVVTGASTGFGRLSAETLARGGYRVFATMREIRGRNANIAHDIESLAGHEALALHALEIDVTDEESIARAIDEVMARYGRIDILINNAGYGIVDLAETVTPAQAQRLFDTNFFGALRMSRAVLPAMKHQRSGLLLHVSSGAGRLVVPGLGLYAASKFALEALAEAYRYELAPIGIDSVVIEPGAYRTPIMMKLESGEDSAREAGYGAAAEIPGIMRAYLTKADADPQEVADSILKIVETPPGQRQLRYRVSSNDSGVSGINALTDEVQTLVLEAFGLTEIIRFKER